MACLPVALVAASALAADVSGESKPETGTRQTSASAPAAPFACGFEAMERPERLPFFLPNGTQTRQFITYDPAGQNRSGFFKRYEENGEYVFFDEVGPGCLYRQQMNVFASNWTQFPNEEIRIRYYFDDEPKPRIDLTFAEFFGKGGKYPPPTTAGCRRELKVRAAPGVAPGAAGLAALARTGMISGAVAVAPRCVRKLRRFIKNIGLKVRCFSRYRPDTTPPAAAPRAVGRAPRAAPVTPQHKDRVEARLQGLRRAGLLPDNNSSSTAKLKSRRLSGIRASAARARRNRFAGSTAATNARAPTRVRVKVGVIG